MTTSTLKTLLADDNPYGIKGIRIPRIQRAYAQGRTDNHAVKTRERFLSAIHSALQHEGMTLDFIYGNIQEGHLIPLDGQQRLTTLWLLHWYADRKENIGDEGLARFSYNTRYSARDFLIKLSGFHPSWQGNLSEEIRNQGWFPMEWMDDPTVSGMLTMLDEIQKRFADIDSLWEKLDKIDFYFRDIREMELTDDIYIKMNSRGRPLTDFEHFKAEMLRVIRDNEPNSDTAKRIGLKIDREWTDLLWPYRDSDNLIDNGFLRYFRIITLILIYKGDHSASEYSMEDDFDLLERVYKDNPTNIEFLGRAFDCLSEMSKKGSQIESLARFPIAVFFKNYLSSHHHAGKVVIPQQITHLDILEGIVGNHALRRNTPYWTVMLYSFLLYVMHLPEIEDSVFRRRLRIVVNLMKNSRYEVVDNPNSDAGNRIPAILRQVENIILEGVISDNIVIDGQQRQNFNVVQMEEERGKLEFTMLHPESAEDLFTLEDYPLLEGRVAIVGYENTDLYSPFMRLFNTCSRDLIDCALLAMGDYSQRVNYWSVQLGSANEGEEGSKAWYALFHPTIKNPDFEHTKEILRTLLRYNPEADDACLSRIAAEYVEKCRETGLFDWRYYYIAYPCFRPERFGKYLMYADRPYEMVALHAEKRESSNAFLCMLQALIESDALEGSTEWHDTRRLNFRDGQLTCENDAFVLYEKDTPFVRARLPIKQDETSIDIMDRILYFKDHAKDATAWIGEL